MSNVLISGVVSAVVSAIASKVTLSHDKKRKVFEKREEAYVTLFELVDEIVKDPEQIYNADILSKLRKVRIHLKVFASKDLLCTFEELYSEINKKWEVYCERYYTDDRLLLDEEEEEYINREECEFIANNTLDDVYMRGKVNEMSTIMRRDIGAEEITVEYRLEKAKARIKATMKWLKSNARLKKNEKKGE